MYYKQSNQTKIQAGKWVASCDLHNCLKYRFDSSRVYIIIIIIINNVYGLLEFNTSLVSYYFTLLVDIKP